MSSGLCTVAIVMSDMVLLWQQKKKTINLTMLFVNAECWRNLRTYSKLKAFNLSFEEIIQFFQNTLLIFLKPAKAVEPNKSK